MSRPRAFTPKIIDSLRNSFENAYKEKHMEEIEQMFSFSSEGGISFSSEEGWSLGYLDFKMLSDSYSSITLKEDYTVYIFKWIDDMGGFSMPYAFPKTMSILSVSEEFIDWASKYYKSKSSNTPKPISALSNFMKAIDGDGSPLSYISASMFSRGVEEVGAFWHGLSWSTENMLYEDPEDLYQAYLDQKEIHTEFDKMMHEKQFGEASMLDNLKWQKLKPKNWEPIVYEKNEKIIVKFFTFSGSGRVTISVHYDIYAPGYYVFDTKSLVIATGGLGYTF